MEKEKYYLIRKDVEYSENEEYDVVEPMFIITNKRVIKPEMVKEVREDYYVYRVYSFHIEEEEILFTVVRIHREHRNKVKNKIVALKDPQEYFYVIEGGKINIEELTEVIRNWGRYFIIPEKLLRKIEETQKPLEIKKGKTEISRKEVASLKIESLWTELEDFSPNIKTDEEKIAIEAGRGAYLIETKHRLILLLPK